MANRENLSMSPNRIKIFIFAVVVFCSTAFSQIRVAHWNVAKMIGDTDAILYVLEELHLDDSEGWAQPVDIITFNEITSTELSQLAALLNQSAPTGVAYTQATFTSIGNENNSGGAQAMFFRTNKFTEIPSLHADIFTDAGRYADRWVLQLNGYSSSNARICVYGAHLKASQGSDNAALRNFGATAIRQNVIALGNTIPVIYTGDMNFYTNSEAGYQTFIAAGIAAAVDPYGSGSWAGVNNAYKHTQAPAVIGLNGLVGGGLDDRFDFIMPSTSAADNNGIAMIQNTMRAVGNDGDHYDKDINFGNNTYYSNLTRSNVLSDELWIASDHIPQILDFQIPAKMSASFVNLPTKVELDSFVQLTVKIQNNATYYTTLGVDELNYSVNCSGKVSGTYSGIAALNPSYTLVNVNLNTSMIGNATGTVTISSNSEAVEPATTSLTFSIRVYMLGDLDESGIVDSGDLAIMLLNFGACVNCDEDLDENGIIDFGDIAILLLLYS